MFWKGKLPAAIKLDAAQVEVYSTGRYLTLTGHRIAGTPDAIAPAPKTLQLLRARVETFKEAEARARSEETIVPASGPGIKSARHRKGEPEGPKKAPASSNPFWRIVNDMAFGQLEAWVPDVFGGAAVYQPGTGAWRISSQALGRDLEEDLSIHPNGATDWGTRESLTAIDLVERFGSAGSAKVAALWLCDRCGVEPATLGWDPDYSAGLKPLGDVLFGQRAASPQPKATARGPVADEARELLRKCLREIMGNALLIHEARRATNLDDNEIADRDDDRKLFDPTHSAIKITAGTGKSDLSRQETANYYIPEAKRLSLPHRVLKLVPTHKLAGEARSKMPAGVTVAVWQGRGGTKLGTDEPMCRNPEAVEAALKIGANVEKTACKSKKARCPFYESCLYQQQKARGQLGRRRVRGARDPVPGDRRRWARISAWSSIDEGFWQDGLTTKSRLVISSLADEVKEFPVRDHNGGRLDYETLHLCELIERVQQALEAMPDGYVQRQPLIDAGLRPASGVEDSSCTAARKLEWQRKIKTGLQPGAGEETRQRAVKKFGFMGRLPRRAAMWHALDDLIAGSDEATGRLLIETSETKEGPQRYLRLLGRKEIADKLTRLPLIVADATLPFDLVKHFLPDLELTLDIKVEAPFMKVTQLAGLPVGKASLQALEPGKRTPEKEERVARKRQRLVDTCRHLIQGRRGLIVTYKSIEKAFAGIEGTETGHFNAIEGVDRWKDVDAMVTIGRPLPRSEDIEHLAAAVTGNPIVAGPTIETYRPIGPGHLLRCRAYGEPAAEMIRAAVTEAAIEQAVGRARGVIRTEANPVEIYVILNDTVVPDLPVDDVVTFQSMEPDAVDHMVMRGLVPESGTAAHKLHDDLFPSPEAARKAFERAQLDVAAGTRNRAPGGHSVTSSYRNISIRECHAVARYQTLGARQRTRLVRVRSGQVSGSARRAGEGVRAAGAVLR